MLLVAVFGTLFLLLALRVPIFVALGGATIVGVVLHPSASLIDVVRNSINGIDSLVLFAAPLFVLAGNLILAGGVSRRLIGWVDLLFGFSRLRLAYVNVFGSMFFGGISGSATADSAAIGSVLVPEMKKGGYPTPYAAGVTAASSSIGIIVPPSVPMILAGAATSVSVTKLFVGGYGPGILIAVSLALVAWIRRPRSGVMADPERFSLKRMGITTYKALPALVFPVVIMGGILTGVFTATEAAAVAVVYSLLVAVFIYREMGWKAFFKILKESAEFAAVVFSIVATAQAFGRFLTLAKVPQQLTEFMLGFSKTPAVVILMMIVLLLIIGTFMETVPIVLVLYPILEPIATSPEVGMDPIHYGVTFMGAIAVGLLTPPYGVLLFVNSKIAGIPSADLIKAVLPFIAILIVDVLIIAFFPPLSLAPVNFFFG
ncbi:MAG: TRAP transporter large permease [bacterium]|nr:TRAP transporter large permease [bacterium]MDE0287578.1 TRAP transporter large permease [bacterium]MDE0440248.1 TRAP transporter large permease [bacterium]